MRFQGQPELLREFRVSPGNLMTILRIKPKNQTNERSFQNLVSLGLQRPPERTVPSESPFRPNPELVSHRGRQSGEAPEDPSCLPMVAPAPASPSLVAALEGIPRIVPKETLRQTERQPPAGNGWPSSP